MHQAISVKMERQFGLLRSELNKELLIVVIRPEDKLAVIAASDDVREPALNFEFGLRIVAHSIMTNGEYELQFDCTPDPNPSQNAALPASEWTKSFLIVFNCTSYWSVAGWG